MPSESIAQKTAAEMALAAKRGHIPVKKLTGSALSMYQSMNERQLSEFASTPRADLPYRKTPAVRPRKYKVLGRNP